VATKPGGQSQLPVGCAVEGQKPFVVVFKTEDSCPVAVPNSKHCAKLVWNATIHNAMQRINGVVNLFIFNILYTK
jgi:hypothetical protein